MAAYRGLGADEQAQTDLYSSTLSARGVCRLEAVEFTACAPAERDAGLWKEELVTDEFNGLSMFSL